MYYAIDILNSLFRLMKTLYLFKFINVRCAIIEYLKCLINKKCIKKMYILHNLN